MRNKNLCILLTLMLVLSSRSLFAEKMKDGPKGPPLPYMGPWMKMIDAGMILKKYDLQRQQNELDLKKQMLPINDKRNDILKKLNDLAKDIGQKDQIISLTKELFELEQEAFTINMNFQDKEKEITKAIQEEFKKAIEAYLEKIESDDKELQLYLDQILKKDKPPRK